MTSTPTAKISLSGYLPGARHNGLERMASALANAFEAAHAAGDETGETTRVVVVGILDVASITLPADPAQPRAVGVKFIQIEALSDADLAQPARLLLTKAREARTGSTDQAIDGMDSAIVESSAGTSTASAQPGTRAKRSPAKRAGRRLGVAGVAE